MTIGFVGEHLILIAIFRNRKECIQASILPTNPDPGSCPIRRWCDSGHRGRCRRGGRGMDSESSLNVAGWVPEYLLADFCITGFYGLKA